MNETDAKCIISSVWTLKECLGKDYTVRVSFEADSNEVEITIRKNWKTVFAHTWQEGDTVDSFLGSLNIRVNYIFELES